MGHVVMMDSTVVTMEDLGCQFFLSEDDVGKRTRAEASVAGLQVPYFSAFPVLPLPCAPTALASLASHSDPVGCDKALNPLAQVTACAGHVDSLDEDRCACFLPPRAVLCGSPRAFCMAEGVL